MGVSIDDWASGRIAPEGGGGVGVPFLFKGEDGKEETWCVPCAAPDPVARPRPAVRRTEQSWGANLKTAPANGLFLAKGRGEAKVESRVIHPDDDVRNLGHRPLGQVFQDLSEPQDPLKNLDPDHGMPEFSEGGRLRPP